MGYGLMRAVDLFLVQWQRAEASGLPCDGYYHDGKTMRVRIGKRPAKQKRALPLCGAQCRDGHPCKARVCLKSDGSVAKRCRLHGGASTGPKSTEGRQSIADSNRRRAKGIDRGEG